MMTFTSVLTALPIVAHGLIVVLVATRIVVKRRETGESMAWLTLVAVFPLFGAVMYLFVGELWLARNRLDRTVRFAASATVRLNELRALASDGLHAESDSDRALHAYGDNALNAPALHGNRLACMTDSGAVFDAMISDIESSRQTCHLLFYICSPEGKVASVLEALIRAAERGVSCRLLVDAVGSGPFLNSEWMERLRDAKVMCAASMPVGRIRARLSRIDVRNHRKVVAIDGRIAYCGSLNLIDPANTTSSVAGAVGRWVDVMARIEGPSAETLDMVMMHDWIADYEGELPEESEWIRTEAPSMPGDSTVQVVSSGPGQSPRATSDMMLTMIFGARRELVITTPYFVPNESVLTSMICAARRGVHVRLILPYRLDSRLVRLASYAFYDDLLAEGIEIHRFMAGLLHTKTITADGELAFIGSANMDRRSFDLNYETSLFVFTDDDVQHVREIQLSYLADSERVDAEEWSKRPYLKRVVSNAVQLFSPLL
jgi:cardiolipin synthase